MTKPEILVVDDEVDNVDALERLFRKKYVVHKAISGPHALKILSQHPSIALLISDQRMPEMTGVDFLAESIKTHPESIRMLLTGYTDIDSVIGAINSGQIYRYVTKPWDSVDLTNAVDKAIERYQLQQELKEKNRALEAALRELRSLDEAKTNFMILVNHELKTPLTVLSSFLDLLQESKLDDDQTMYVNRICKSRDRLLIIIEEVIELVAAETGQLQLHKKKLNLLQLFDRVIQNLNPAAQLKRQTFDSQLMAKTITADEDLLGRVITRILDNAIKYGEADSNIHIRTEKDRKKTKVTISNRSKPLSDEVLQKITQPFVVNENIMHHSKGLGLGLSLSQALLRLHESQLMISYNDQQVHVSFVI